MYQQFCDRNLELKKREDELKLSINGLEAREVELRKTTAELQQQLAVLQGNYGYNLEIKQKDLVSTNDISAPQTDTSINYHQNGSRNKVAHYETLF